jgi:hypothetical protein
MFSFDSGIIQSFFDNALTLNAEVFYNGEDDSYSMKHVNLLDDEKEVFPLISGFNMALNVGFRPKNFYKLRLFTTFLYAAGENSGHIIPGIRIEPVRHITLYAAMTAAIGNPDGTYYRQNADIKNRPFSFVFALILNGNYNCGYYN